MDLQACRRRRLQREKIDIRGKMKNVKREEAREIVGAMAGVEKSDNGYCAVLVR